MITGEELSEAIQAMRRTGPDRLRWEIAEAAADFPKSLLETMSAFANTKGGRIILGLSEKAGFRPAKDFDADRILSQVQAMGERLTPALQLEAEKIPFEGSVLVVVEVQPLPAAQKPCHITTLGPYAGAFLRTADGNRRLSAYEVDRLWEMRTQPRFDLEPVAEADVGDLDPSKIERIVLRCRELFPRVFEALPKEQILLKLGVLARSGDKLCPTIAGLFAAGTFPQQYFPRLEVVFSAFPGTTKVPIANSNQRYLNAREIIGPIPDMIWETLACVQERMNTAAVVVNGLRHDVPDFPMAAVREAIANALQHRDYSPEGRGTHIQVNLYSDRLEILNPGGLYGSTEVESLDRDGISSSRNAFLSRLLAYTPFESGFVVENKGTGFRVIQSELERAGLPPPRIQNSPSFFRITFEKRRGTLPNPAAAATGDSPCKQCVPQGSAPFKPAKLKGKELEAIALEKIREEGSVTAAELAALSGLSRPAVRLRLKAMLEKGVIEPMESNRSPKQRYRLKPASKEEA